MTSKLDELERLLNANADNLGSAIWLWKQAPALVRICRAAEAYVNCDQDTSPDFLFNELRAALEGVK